MRFGNRAFFSQSLDGWVVMPAVELAKDDLQHRVDGGTAAGRVDEWFRNPSSWPKMLNLFERVTGSTWRTPTRFDVEQRIKPMLREALKRGRLVALRMPRAARDNGNFGVEPLPEIPDAVKKATTKVAEEKTFLDIQVVNSKGKPLVGRHYKIELPDGRTEKGKLGPEARIHLNGIDPGKATFTFVPGEGDVFEGGDLEPEDPVGDTVVVFLQDGAGQPMANAVYRMKMGKDVREGTADGDGKIEELGMPEGGTCTLAWGPPPPEENPPKNPFVYERVFNLDVEGTDDASVLQQLANLGYVSGTLEEKLAAFHKEYDGEVADVHMNGTPGKPPSSDEKAA